MNLLSHQKYFQHSSDDSTLSLSIHRTIALFFSLRWHQLLAASWEGDGPAVAPSAWPPPWISARQVASPSLICSRTSDRPPFPQWHKEKRMAGVCQPSAGEKMKARREILISIDRTPGLPLKSGFCSDCCHSPWWNIVESVESEDEVTS